MNKIKDILNQIKNMPNCIVKEPYDISNSIYKDIMPNDLVEFYILCGGISFYINKDEPIHILSIDEISPANAHYWTDEIIEMEKTNNYNEWDCNNWFLVANLENANYILIDLSKNKKGKCYLGLWESYSVEGETPIIANSFTELLENILKYEQNEWFWKQSSFLDLNMGDAYS